jgi:hypothetical protein
LAIRLEPGRSSSAAPTSPASAGGILRAPRGPVDLDRHALRVGSRFDQVKCHVRAGAGEQPRALAENHRDDEQGHLVDQVVLEQPADQDTAAVYLQLTRRLGLQLADGDCEVIGQDGRVRPARFGERDRGDVLGVSFNTTPMGWARISSMLPGAGEELVGPPAEQERVGALVGPGDQRPGLVVARPLGPSAALESVPAVLIRRAAVSLHHSVDGNLRHDRQFHDRGSLLLWAPLTGTFHPAMNASASIRHRPADFSGDFQVRRSQAIRQRDGLWATALTSSRARPVQTSSGTRSVAKTLTSRPPQ